MKRYVIRRLLMAIPLLLAISFVCFVFINMIPSNPAEVVLLSLIHISEPTRP